MKRVRRPACLRPRVEFVPAGDDFVPLYAKDCVTTFVPAPREGFRYDSDGGVIAFTAA
jgi:hypothetical protein